MVTLFSILLFCSKDKCGTSFPSSPFQDRIFYLWLSTCLRVSPASERTLVFLEDSGQLSPLSSALWSHSAIAFPGYLHHIVPWWQINLLTYKPYYNTNPLIKLYSWLLYSSHSTYYTVFPLRSQRCLPCSSEGVDPTGQERGTAGFPQDRKEEHRRPCLCLVKLACFYL